MHKFFFKISAIVVIVIGCWAGYEYFSNKTAAIEGVEKKFSEKKVVFGMTKWPGYMPLYIAKDQGYFDDAGLNLEIKTYDNLGDLSKDYREGKIQGRANITVDAIDESYQGLDHKIILVSDSSNGADAIVGRDSVKTFAAMKGKKVAFEHGTLEEFFLRYALEQNDMSIEDIKGVDLSPEDSVTALLRGEVDVAVTHEPFLTVARKQENIHVLYTSKNAPGLITDILTFRSDFLDKNHEWVQAFVQAYFKGYDFYKTNPNEGIAILAKNLGVSREEVVGQLRGLSLKDLRDNRTAFTFAAGLQSLYGNLRQTNEFVRVIRSSPTGLIDTDAIVEPKFIRGLK